MTNGTITLLKTKKNCTGQSWWLWQYSILWGRLRPVADVCQLMAMTSAKQVVNKLAKTHRPLLTSVAYWSNELRSCTEACRRSLRNSTSFMMSSSSERFCSRIESCLSTLHCTMAMQCSLETCNFMFLRFRNQWFPDGTLLLDITKSTLSIRLYVCILS